MSKTFDEISRELKAPFKSEDIEWRIQSAGKKGDKIWARVLAYIDNRAIMERLDEVVGPGNWKQVFMEVEGGFICSLSIRVEDEWVTKSDGAQRTDIEPLKGGVSDSMKRAAVQWGMGRYLYKLEAGFALVGEKGKYYCPADKKGQKYPAFRWSPPPLPKWALPEGEVQDYHEKIKGCKSVADLIETGEIIKVAGLDEDELSTLHKEYKEKLDKLKSPTGMEKK